VEERVTVVAVRLAELPVLEPARSIHEFLTTKYRGLGWNDQRNISPYKRRFRYDGVKAISPQTEQLYARMSIDRSSKNVFTF